MSCSSCFTTLSDEKSRKLMYGPLYAKYAHSNAWDVHLKRTFSNERSLIPQYVPDCCAYISTNFKASKYWSTYLIIICVWFAYAAIMLAAFLSIRKTQLVKIRGTRATIAYLFTVAGLVCFSAIFPMTSSSEPKFLLPILMLIFMPFYLFLPILKSLQVLFIYKWHEAKAKRLENLKWFTRWKFVLSMRFYVIASLSMFVVVVVPLVVSLFLVSPAFTGHGRTSFSSLRCSWWHIPEELTVASTNSSMCGCIRASFFAEGNQQLLCEEGFLGTCFGSSSITELESELCTSCSSALTSGSTSAECEDAFLNFYASGACGFPSRTPYFGSCVEGAFADQRIMFSLFSVSYFFLGLHVLVIAPLFFKHDYFGTISENILTLLNSAPPITSILLHYEFPGMVSWWSSELPFIVIIPVITAYIMPIITLGVPIILHLWRKRKVDLGVFSGTVEPSAAIASMESADDTVEVSATDPNLTVVKQCIASEPLRTVYLKFSVEEFTTENIRFLEECMQILVTFSSPFEIEAFVMQAQHLYDQYIAAESDMEVNLPWSMKTRVQKHLEALHVTTSGKTISDAAQVDPENPSLSYTTDEVTKSTEEELLETLKDVFVEVLRLMARSSWPRFKNSRHYPEFLEKKSALERHKMVEMQVMAWLGNGPIHNPLRSLDPNPNCDPTSQPTTNHPKTSGLPSLTRHSSVTSMDAGMQNGTEANSSPSPSPLSRKQSFNLFQLYHTKSTDIPTP